MLSILTKFLRSILKPTLFYGGFVTMILTVFKRVEWGFFLMVVLIPQPNVFFKLDDYPMGKDFMDYLFFAVLLGILFQRKVFVKTDNLFIISSFIAYSYFSLWVSSMHFFLPLPISASSSLLRHWKDYAQMIFMYFVVLNIIRDKEQPKAVVVTMSLVVLFIAMRSFRAYSGGASYTGSRYEGIFWVEGLGANHFAAFIAYNWAIFLGLFLLEANKWRKILFLVTVLFSIHPLFFSYSRGAYVAALGVLVLYGILRKRSLLILVVIIMMAWKTLLPPSVVDRISMTYDESGELEYSASVRLKLWDYAMSLFEKNPVIGAGSGSFGLMIPEELSRYKDTHNYFVKTLSEQGIVGITLLLIILYRALRSGWRLLSIGMTPFYKGLGMGFLGCIIAMIITNIFGDRWSYFVLGGYFWIFWGLVDRSIIISQDMHSSEKVASA